MEQPQPQKTLSDTIFSNIKKYENPEYKYLNLLEHVLEKGHLEEGRNGKLFTSFGHSMRFSLENGTIPILTTKKTAWKTCLKELLWFISGKTDNTILQKQGVHIWDANASREFLQSRNLDYADGELGPIYGHQWRHFDAKWQSNQESNIENLDLGLDKGIDQLQNIIDELKNSETRTSRRLIMTAWNPKQLGQMALPPCHILCQFSVHDGNKLSCALYQRSADLCLGVPFNIASYSFLTHLLAKHCDLEAFEFVHFMGNVHIYEPHIEAAKLQLQREPYDFPKVEIGIQRMNINDYVVDDFKVINYQSYDAIKMDMIA